MITGKRSGTALRHTGAVEVDGWGEEIPLDDLMTVVHFPVYGVSVPLVEALELVITAPESFRWIRLDGPRVFLDRDQAMRCRADALLMLAVWIAERGLPLPTATAVYRTYSESVLDLDDTQIDVLAVLASVNVLDGNCAAVSLDRLAAGLPAPSEAIRERLVDLEGISLVAPDPEGWLLRSDPPRKAPTGPDTYMTNWGPTSVLVLDGMAESRRLEGWGLHLVQMIISQMQGVPSVRLRAALAEPVLGPEFDYGSSWSIFGSRTGIGPLYIAWDTNLLVDYFDYGAALWRGERIPENLDEKTYNAMEQLKPLLALSVVRDIRMVLLPHALDDFGKRRTQLDEHKKKLMETRKTNRLRAFDRFEAALSLLETGDADLDPISREGLRDLPSSALEDALQFVPAGGDRELVRQAVKRGVHIFLSKDDGVLRARDRLAPFGLYITNPGDLLEEMVAAGAYNCMLAPNKMYWPLPDQQRVANLIESLPASDL